MACASAATAATAAEAPSAALDSRNGTLLRALERAAAAREGHDAVHSVHLVLLGADRWHEGASPSQVRERLRPMLGELRTRPRLQEVRRFCVVVCGANLTERDGEEGEEGGAEEEGGGVAVRVLWRVGFLHEMEDWRELLWGRADGGDASAVLRIVAMLNAGVWGYVSWLETMDCLCDASLAGLTVVVTAYSQKEAEDDWDTIDERCTDRLDWLWDCETNDCAAATPRVKSGPDADDTQVENAVWSAFRVRPS